MAVIERSQTLCRDCTPTGVDKRRPCPVCFGWALTGADAEVEAFYSRSAWRIGTQVVDRANPTVRGDLVRRVARNWVDRDRKPPMVRWRGKIDAVEVPWHQLDAS